MPVSISNNIARLLAAGREVSAKGGSGRHFGGVVGSDPEGIGAQVTV